MQNNDSGTEQKRARNGGRAVNGLNGTQQKRVVQGKEDGGKRHVKRLNLADAGGSISISSNDGKQAGKPVELV